MQSESHGAVTTENDVELVTEVGDAGGQGKRKRKKLKGL
ncbi:hypothetical protein GYH30_042930 [Glycine max]|nr:hypothetical protein GYH30_042930 [Glycine max]